MIRVDDLSNGIVIIVARNNLHLTKRAVKSALTTGRPVMLVDNASSDGTSQWARTKPIIHIGHQTQLSLAACWNSALEWAWHLSPHALILNNDVEIRPDTYDLLLVHGGPFVTCISVDSHERLNPRCIATSERPHPDFSCFLIRKEVTDKIGWFDEQYEIAYAEDCDLHVRMHRAGIKAVAIDVPFLHHGAATMKNASAEEKNKIRHAADRNRQYFHQKWGKQIGMPEYDDLFQPVEDHP